MLLLHWKKVLVTALWAVTSLQPAWGQAGPPVILQVEIQNRVRYFDDVFDVSKFATNPSVAPAASSKNFTTTLSIGDIVAVNNQPAQGTMTTTTRSTNLRQAPNSGEAIADTIRSDMAHYAFEILTADGTPIGTIMGFGVGGGSPPPGATDAITQGNNAIIGGTGAFLGARGNLGQLVNAATVTIRSASVAEDPSNRRQKPGGRNFYVLQVIPMTRPQIADTGSGPAVFHADFSPVSAARPASAGEVLIVKANGLGPTVPGVNPGQPFPAGAQINSPVDVTVNGKSADVINKIGWPGLMDTYRVDFRVPDGVATGTAAVQLTAAWIAGSAVNIPIQ